MKAIDVSSVQKEINWKKVRADEVEHAIIRTILKRGKPDPRAKENFEAAKAVGISTDAYKYCYAMSGDEAIIEAMKVVDFLKSIPVSCKIWWDMEWENQRNNLTRQQITDLVKAAADVILDAGFEFGVYCNLDWYRNVLLSEQLPYDFWIARYPKKSKDDGTLQESLRPNVGEKIWQYTSKGKVDGISTYVDLNDMNAIFAFYPRPAISKCFASCGMPASYSERKIIAAKNGMPYYTGTVDENMYLMALWVQGRLIR